MASKSVLSAISKYKKAARSMANPNRAAEAVKATKKAAKKAAVLRSKAQKKKKKKK